MDLLSMRNSLHAMGVRTRGLNEAEIKLLYQHRYLAKEVSRITRSGGSIGSLDGKPGTSAQATRTVVSLVSKGKGKSGKGDLSGTLDIGEIQDYDEIMPDLK
ncbi:MAG: hypothetical protein AAGI38_00250 [Bacteroidota bacterium]